MSKINRGYARLAEAIIVSGIKANDRFFMESEWFKFLRDFVNFDARLYSSSVYDNKQHKTFKLRRENNDNVNTQ